MRRSAERFSMCENEISRQILDAAIAVHKDLGDLGPLESGSIFVFTIKDGVREV